MYVISPRQEPYSLKEAFNWGCFVSYTEYAEDGFARRSVNEYENGYLTRYDRVHWDDQFGTLPDFRFGEKWKENWGEPKLIEKSTFEIKWLAAEKSAPYKLRNSSPSKPCIWIELYEKGKWSGQP